MKNLLCNYKLQSKWYENGKFGSLPCGRWKTNRKHTLMACNLYDLCKCDRGWNNELLCLYALINETQTPVGFRPQLGKFEISLELFKRSKRGTILTSDGCFPFLGHCWVNKNLFTLNCSHNKVERERKSPRNFSILQRAIACLGGRKKSLFLKSTRWEFSRFWKEQPRMMGGEEKGIEWRKGKINIRCVGKPQDVFSAVRFFPIIIVHSPGKTRPRTFLLRSRSVFRFANRFFNLVINEPYCSLIEMNLC